MLDAIFMAHVLRYILQEFPYRQEDLSKGDPHTATGLLEVQSLGRSWLPHFFRKPLNFEPW